MPAPNKLSVSDRFFETIEKQYTIYTGTVLAAIYLLTFANLCIRRFKKRQENPNSQPSRKCVSRFASIYSTGFEGPTAVGGWGHSI